MPEQRGSVRVTVADSERDWRRRGARLAVIVLAALLASAGVVGAVRLLTPSSEAGVGPPPSALDANSVTVPSATVPDTTRLALLGPVALLDSRATGALDPGSEVDLPVPELPAGSTAVLLEVSVVQATGAGAITVESDAGETTVVQVPDANVMTTATTVVPIGPDAQLRARTEAGGHLVVNLLGAFEPAGTAVAGRIVPVPATEVLRLVPELQGKDATITLADVPALAGAGSVSAVLVQIAADVGTNGGFVEFDGQAGEVKQELFWSATSGDDRTRDGFAVVPVAGGSFDLRYEAGTLLTVDVVGYVTGDNAPESTAGLVVLVPPDPGPAVEIPAGGSTSVELVPAGGVAGVPADKVAAVLLGVVATGDAPGGVTVSAPGSEPPTNPTIEAAVGAPRPTVTLVAVVDGVAQVDSEAGAAVTLSLQAVTLTG